MAVYFYVRHIVLMFFADPPVDPPAVVVPSPATSVTVGLALVATVALGVRLAAEHPETTLLVNNAGVAMAGDLAELENTTLVVGSWRFAGIGWLSAGDAALAAAS